jgi:hypothetical protein
LGRSFPSSIRTFFMQTAAQIPASSRRPSPAVIPLAGLLVN